MNILFVSRLFDGISGGVERMAIAMMNELCQRGHNIELLSWDLDGATTYYPLNDSVVWHKLNIGDANKSASWSERIKRQWAIRNIVKSIAPDVIIAFQDGPFLTAALACLGLRIPIIAAERNAPHRFDYIKAGKKRAAIFQAFRLASTITVQLQSYIDCYPKYLRNRIVSIPNPVEPVKADFENIRNLQNQNYLLCVGRLSYQKNQSVLINAFACISESAPRWKLIFVGAGEDEDKLKELTCQLNLNDKIDFVGAVKDVNSHYMRSHIFCMPSRWEGFPNAVAEAMSHGLPVIGFSECAGVNQLVVNGENGLLADGNGRVESLSVELLSLMRSDSSRVEMGKAAFESVKKYQPKTIFDTWESLFLKVARYK